MMARKLILDLDPGIGDAIALCAALAEPELEVVAVTATGGCVRPEQATRNVQALIERLDPSRWPRIGAANPEQSLRTDARHLFGPDGLGGAEFAVAELANRHSSLKLLADEIRAAPGQVTVVAGGPLTNLADLFRSDPLVFEQIGHLIIVGGTYAAPGDATPAAEFNFFCDAASADAVLRGPTTKTVLPLDVTTQVTLDLAVLDRLKSAEGRAASLLLQILPPGFRSYRQRLAMEVMHAHEAVGVIAALHPEWFTTQRLHGEVETSGYLTHGAVVFDRRRVTDALPNADVATAVRADAAAELLADLLTRGS